MTDLPELVCKFSTDIPDLPLREARNPSYSDYMLCKGNIPNGMSLGEVWEFEDGDMVMLTYAKGIEPPVGSMQITFEYAD